MISVSKCLPYACKAQDINTWKKINDEKKLKYITKNTRNVKSSHIVNYQSKADTPYWNSKWIEDIHVQLETIKLLVENTGKKLLDVDVGSDFFWMWHLKHKWQKQT